tara:strand:+ start:1210 stop:1365 length:156 start_codon:yes stop_codon:yes gene_type:complete
MSDTLLFLVGFIIVSYLVGIWVGTKIKKPRVIVREAKTGRNKRDAGLPRRR